MLNGELCRFKKILFFKYNPQSANELMQLLTPWRAFAHSSVLIDR